MKTISHVRVTLRGHYNPEDEATVIVQDGRISARAWHAAERRAGLIDGDYLEMADRGMPSELRALTSIDVYGPSGPVAIIS